MKRLKAFAAFQNVFKVMNIKKLHIAVWSHTAIFLRSKKFLSCSLLMLQKVENLLMLQIHPF